MMTTGLVYALIGLFLAQDLQALDEIEFTYAGKRRQSHSENLNYLKALISSTPGAQGIYGFLVAILILIKVQLIGGNPSITNEQGLKFFASLPMLCWFLLSGIYQVKLSALLTAKRPELSVRGMTMTALVETYAILTTNEYINVVQSL